MHPGYHTKKDVDTLQLDNLEDCISPESFDEELMESNYEKLEDILKVTDSIKKWKSQIHSPWKKI